MATHKILKEYKARSTIKINGGGKPMDNSTIDKAMILEKIHQVWKSSLKLHIITMKILTEMKHAIDEGHVNAKLLMTLTQSTLIMDDYVQTLNELLSKSKAYFNNEV